MNNPTEGPKRPEKKEKIVDAELDMSLAMHQAEINGYNKACDDWEKWLAAQPEKRGIDEKSLRKFIDSHDDCPYCPNEGFYVETDYNGDPEQIQCEWCYTEPKSKFNIPKNISSHFKRPVVNRDSLAKAMSECIYYGRAPLNFLEEQADAIIKHLEGGKENGN